MAEIVIYGAGGFAREVAWLAEESGFSVRAFVDDNPDRWGDLLNEIPVMSLEQASSRFPQAQMVVAVGAPKTREALSKKAEQLGFKFATLVHPEARRSKWVEIGEGAVITAGNILTTNIRLGKHVQINLNCTIGHDVIMEDYATLAPGVHISGWVYVGRRAYIGTGAVILNGKQGEPIVIGEDAVVGAGAVVTKSVLPATTVVGVPARPLQR